MKDLKILLTKFSGVFTIFCLFFILNPNETFAADYTIIIKKIYNNGDYTTISMLNEFLGSVRCFDPDSNVEIALPNESEDNAIPYRCKITSDYEKLKLECKFIPENKYKTVEINNLLFNADKNNSVCIDLLSGSTTSIEFIESSINYTTYKLTLSNLSSNSIYDDKYIDNFGRIMYTLDDGVTWYDINTVTPIFDENSCYYAFSIKNSKNIKLKCEPSTNNQLYIDNNLVDLSEENCYIFSLGGAENIDIKFKNHDDISGDNDNKDINNIDKNNKSETDKTSVLIDDINGDINKSFSENNNLTDNNVENTSNYTVEKYEVDDAEENRNLSFLATGDPLDENVVIFAIIAVLYSIILCYFIKTDILIFNNI